MELIADSGGTKTNWAAIDENNDIQFFESPGLHPGVQLPGELKNTLLKDLPQPLSELSPKKVFFYGAACSGKENVQLMETLLKETWPASDIFVDHDLNGAARAGLGEMEGIAAVIGTGSSSGYYNGKNVHQIKPSLGFILGDEGSGAWLGKNLIRDFCYGELPEYAEKEVRSILTNSSLEEILHNVYKEKNPNTYLASLTPALANIKHQAYASKLIKRGFGQFIDRHISSYSESSYKTIAFSGSIAFHFKNFLEEVCFEKGYRNFLIIKDPLQGIINYHLKKKKA